MTAAAPTVSVIVNCYNGERYLQEALDSIAAQTLTDFEVIFWDNGSTDRSAEIARGFGDRLRYFRATETTPLGAARNLAVAEASGEFIAFLDTDDRWYPHTLATLLDAMSPEVDVCYAGLRNIDASGGPLGAKPPAARSGDLLDPLLRQFDVWVQSLLLRRSALVRTGLGFDPAITASEEYCLFIQLAAEVAFRSIPDVLVDYRIHEEALTARSIEKWADERFYTLERLLTRRPELREKHADAFAEAFARGFYYRARKLMAEGRRREARAALKQAAPAGSTYRLLHLLAFAPTPLWNMVHSWKTQRTIG